MKIEMKSTVDIDVELLARCFADLDDDSQCRFFVEVARLAEKWERPAEQQWYFVGGHLRNCECSTPEARQMIESIYLNMQTSTHN